MPYSITRQRIAFDAIGALVVYINTGGTIAEYNATQIQNMNNEDQADMFPISSVDAKAIAIIFPFAHDLTGYFIGFDGVGGSRGFAALLEWSADSTNGQDGSWTTIINPYVVNLGSAHGGALIPDFITEQNALSVLGAKAIRFNQTWGGTGTTGEALHLYGSPSSTAASATADFLRIWKSVAGGDAEASPSDLDWGDVPRGSSATKTFRVRNEADNLTANGIVVSAEILYDATPAIADDFLFKLATDPDGSYAATYNIGNLAAGAVSADIMVKRTTPTNAQLGIWVPRIKAQPTSWS